ncbi:MAG: helix-turn-helix domain-containing protein [Opitutaceae bacterium]
MDQIRKHHATPLSIGDVARHCGQSLRQLQRRFHHAFGITPQEFLIKTRVVAAARLLEETSLSAAEIARRCGFMDQSAFSQQFHQRTGATPMACRRSRLAPFAP